MNDILDKFIKELFIRAMNIPFNKLPQEISSIIYDPRFNIPEIHDIKYIEDEPGLCYRYIFQEIENMITNKKIFYICNSSDLNDGPEVGDHNYYIGLIDNEIALLYLQSSHPHSIPNRLIIMDKIFSYEIWSCKIGIEIYPVLYKTRRLIIHSNSNILNHRLKYVNKIISLLKSQDRPELNKI